MEQTAWVDWRQRYPATQVLSTDTGFHRDYTHAPYVGYASSDIVHFPVSHADNRYHAKELVVGVEIDGHFKAYPLSELKHSQGKVIDEIQGQKLFIYFNKAYQSARVENSQGELIASTTLYWFAWMAFHPDSAVFSEE